MLSEQKCWRERTRDIRVGDEGGDKGDLIHTREYASELRTVSDVLYMKFGGVRMINRCGVQVCVPVQLLQRSVWHQRWRDLTLGKEC